MKLNFRRRKLLPLMLVSVLTLAGGCKNQFDIEKAQEFGETAENFEQTYKGIVEDIYDSCMRSARFSIVIKEIGVFENTREDSENQCLEFAQYENALLEAHEVLASYTMAFRELSSDEIIEELEGAKKLAGSLAARPIPGLTEANTEANTLFPLQQVAGELASAIQKAIEDQFRQRVLKESVEEVNTSIQKYIATLAVITDEIYRELLLQEEADMNLYYSKVVERELTKILPVDKNEEDDSENEEDDSNPLQVSVLLVDKQWQEDRQEADYPKKLAAIDSYLKTLKNMADLHQELYVSVQEFQQ